MFEALVAEEITLSTDGVTILAGSIVYFAECSTRDAERLAQTPAPMQILCQMEMSDDAMFLVAFSSEERRKLYRALRKVSGIGRRSAILVLDCGEVIDTLRAVSGKDSNYFKGVPGMGAKRITAVITELEKAYKQALPSELPLPVTMWVEARDGLRHGGLDLRSAELKLRQVMEMVDTLPANAEELIKLASSL